MVEDGHDGAEAGAVSTDFDLFLSSPSSVIRVKSSGNIFDNLPTLAPPTSSELRDELERYLSSDPEHTTDALKWWYDRRAVYPNLSRMALDYLSIPGEYLASDLLSTRLCADQSTHSDLGGCRTHFQPW